jgi:hypothetical protein
MTLQAVNPTVKAEMSKETVLRNHKDKGKASGHAKTKVHSSGSHYIYFNDTKRGAHDSEGSY